MNKTLSGKIKRALKKKALGYSASESVEEYALVDGELALVKKKITIKEVPPDTTAVKLLLELSGESVETLTEEEIKSEKKRLIGMLMED